MKAFWEKFESLCNERGLKPTSAAKEIGVAASSVSSWRHGARPNADALNKLSSYFDVSVEYLVEDEIDVNIMPKNKTIMDKSLDVFNSLMSISQRFTSLRHGEPITQEDISDIAAYVHCKEMFLLLPNQNTVLFLEGDYDKDQLLKYGTIDKIMSLFDKCAEDESKSIIQLQLSKIVLYWLEQVYDIEEIKSWNGTLVNKIDYIKTHKVHINPACDYGFNYSELDYFREKSIKDGKNLSFQYMLTGQQEHIIDIQKNELERKNQELERNNQELERKDQELERKDQELERKDQEIERLKAEIERLKSK